MELNKEKVFRNVSHFVYYLKYLLLMCVLFLGCGNPQEQLDKSGSFLTFLSNYIIYAFSFVFAYIITRFIILFIRSHDQISKDIFLNHQTENLIKDNKTTLDELKLKISGSSRVIDKIINESGEMEKPELDRIIDDTFIRYEQMLAIFNVGTSFAYTRSIRNCDRDVLCFPAFFRG